MQNPNHPTGLTAAEAAARLVQFGPNELVAKKPKTRLQIFLRQFKDAMVVILVIAAIVSFVVGEHTDAYIILAIILGNALLGYTQEYNAARSISKLKQMAHAQATVTRDGLVEHIPASGLVPGDLIHLEAGNLIPADARLLELHAFKTEEAALTGESNAVEKKTDPVDPAASIGDRTDTVFKGTYVSSGSALAEVTATGMQTELGKIAAMLDGETGPTPLQKRLARFSRQLAVIVLTICVIVFVLGLLRGEPALQMFLTALSLAVAALPEALPAVVTIALAKGATVLAGKNALVRRLPVVETLGSVTFICSDKTGTLTQNKMTVERVSAAPGQEALLTAAMLLNTEVKQGAGGVLHGDSTEVALIDYAIAQGYTFPKGEAEYPRCSLLPFDSERMRMTTVHRSGNKWIVLVKGAPVKVSEVLSPAGIAAKDAWLGTNRIWAAEGLRVLAFAAKYQEEEPATMDPDVLEQDLEFIGMCGIIDPPRPEVTAAILDCRLAGITPVMITGDQPLTAEAIARRLQILPEGAPGAVSGAELAKMDAAAFSQTVRTARVYARVSPEQKLLIVRELQESGEFVAMTGDGVNDAPSLRQANIGVAMGITGTDVAKESAGMILLDDNFTTIVGAVREGRRVYTNIRKFVQYVLSCNLGEILVLFLAPFLGLALPLLPIHILWINLVTDGLPGIALVSEPGDPDLMRTPPRPPKESLFAGGMARSIIIGGIILAAVSLAAQTWAVGAGYNVRVQQSLVFTVLCFVQLGNALSVRAGRSSIFTGALSNRFLLFSVVLTIALQLALLYVPLMNSIFKTAPLDGRAILAAVLFSLGGLVLLETTKAAGRLISNKKSGAGNAPA